MLSSFAFILLATAGLPLYPYYQQYKGVRTGFLNILPHLVVNYVTLVVFAENTDNSGKFYRYVYVYIKANVTMILK